MSASVTSATWTETKTCSCGYEGPVTVAEVRGEDHEGFQVWACPWCAWLCRQSVSAPEPTRQRQYCASVCELSLAVWAYGTVPVLCPDCDREERP